MHARYVSSLKEEYVHDIRIYSQFDDKQKASLSAIEDISTKKIKDTSSTCHNMYNRHEEIALISLQR